MKQEAHNVTRGSIRTILLLFILFFLISFPALGELTEADMDKIRLLVKPALGELTDAELNQIRMIVKEEVKTVKEELKTEITRIHSKIDGLDTRLRNVETGVAELRGRTIGVSVLKDWGVALCALGALIVSIIALRKKQTTAPQTPQDTESDAENEHTADSVKF